MAVDPKPVDWHVTQIGQHGPHKGEVDRLPVPAKGQSLLNPRGENKTDGAQSSLHFEHGLAKTSIAARRHLKSALELAQGQ